MTWTVFMRFSPSFLPPFLFFKRQFPSYFQDDVRRRFVSAELKSPSVLHLHLFPCPSLSRPLFLPRSLPLHPQARFSAGSLRHGRPRARCVSFWSCGWLQQGAMWSPALCAPPTLPLPPPDGCWSSSAARWIETEPTEHESFILYHHGWFDYIIRKASWEE